MTMVLFATGHKVRCILWVQVAIFNKEVGLLCGLKFFALNIFCEEHLQPKTMFDVVNMQKNELSKMCQ